MVRGLDLFRDRFREYADSLVLIGGAACDEWFSNVGMTFRPTKDLDIVLLLEAIDADFVATMRRFIADGGYQIREKSEGGPPCLYRFNKATDVSFPYMLEMFTRQPETIELGDDQQIVPIPAGADTHSLSAILLNENYYRLIREHQIDRDGLGMADVTALIPLKSRAWLDLNKRRDAGESVDHKNINKHRSDVFRLAATLPDTAGPELPDSIRADVRSFLDAFPEASVAWNAIHESLKVTIGGDVSTAALRGAIQTYFRLG